MGKLIKKLFQLFFESEAQLISRYQYDHETERLRFIAERDGVEAAIAFARQSMIIYRRHTLKAKGWYSQETRIAFIQSYLHFKQVWMTKSLG